MRRQNFSCVNNWWQKRADEEKEKVVALEKKLLKIAQLANVAYAFDACQHKNIVKQVIEKFAGMDDDTIKGLINKIDEEDD